jgi:hypothetical protein
MSMIFKRSTSIAKHSCPRCCGVNSDDLTKSKKVKGK